MLVAFVSCERGGEDVKQSGIILYNSEIEVVSMQQIYSLHSDDLLIDNLYNVGAYWSPAYFRGEWDKSVMIAAVAFGRN